MKMRRLSFGKVFFLQRGENRVSRVYGTQAAENEPFVHRDFGMTIQLASGSFLQLLALSGLLSDEQMTDVTKRFSSVGNSSDGTSTQDILIWLLKKKLITPWHAEKLVQGRFRGFFLGDYKLLNRVARGGMSTIYAATHKQTGAIHALKVLPLSKTNQASFLQRFQREAAVTQRLSHPNIVRVFGIFSGTDGQADVHFMAMELLRGRDLFEIVNADGPMPCRKAAEFIRQAALGLEHAHKAGLVHRDIKPGNLFLSDDQTVRVLDLGLAQDFDSEENLTREFNERVLGTADYLSPEQAADTHTVDARSDIYSLGCSLYFLLTGQPPFTEGTLVQRLIAHQTKTPPAILEFRRDVPEELNQLLSRMLAKNRKERISTAAEVADQLRDFLKRTETRKVLDEIPIILKRVVSANTIVAEEEVDSVESKSGTLLEGEVTTASDVSVSVTPPALPDKKTSGVAGTPTFLPALSALLRHIETECGVAGPLCKDSRSTRLLELVRELGPLESTVPVPPVVTAADERIASVPAKFTTKADSIPDFSSIESNAPSKWPAEDTVLNDIAMVGFRFDPASITTRTDDEAVTRQMIEQLLTAVDMDSENSTGDSGIPLVTAIDLPRRKPGNKSAKPTQGARNPVVVWCIVGLIGLAVIVVSAIVYSLM